MHVLLCRLNDARVARPVHLRTLGPLLWHGWKGELQLVMGQEFGRIQAGSQLLSVPVLPQCPHGHVTPRQKVKK